MFLGFRPNDMTRLDWTFLDRENPEGRRMFDRMSYTLPKTNIDPDNGQLEECFPRFSGSMLVFVGHGTKIPSRNMVDRGSKFGPIPKWLPCKKKLRVYLMAVGKWWENHSLLVACQSRNRRNRATSVRRDSSVGLTITQLFGILNGFSSSTTLKGQPCKPPRTHLMYLEPQSN